MNYNTVAPFYDWLGKRFFGNKLSVAQSANIESLLHCKKMLIIGGGTGLVLEEFIRRGYKGLIDYVDISSGMINRAVKRKQALDVTFYPCDIRSLKESGYDGVHMAFFLDQFTNEQVSEILGEIRSKLEMESRMVVTDFVPAESRNYRILLRIMYRFFRTVAGIPAKRLPDWQKLLLETGWNPSKSISLDRNRIVSTVYTLHKHQ